MFEKDLPMRRVSVRGRQREGSLQRRRTWQYSNLTGMMSMERRLEREAEAGHLRIRSGCGAKCSGKTLAGRWCILAYVFGRVTLVTVGRIGRKKARVEAGRLGNR